MSHLRDANQASLPELRDVCVCGMYAFKQPAVVRILHGGRHPVSTPPSVLFRYNAPAVKPSQIVAGILAIVFPDAATALDMTPGRGNFWTKKPVIEVAFSEHDFRSLPYADAGYDVAVFDPPHNQDMGRKSIMVNFGTYKNGELEPAIRQGCQEARRISRLGAIVKITDQTHGREFVHESGWVIDELGVPYEITHGQHRPVIDPKWKKPPCSIYSNGSTYLIYRWGSQLHVRREAFTQAS